MYDSDEEDEVSDNDLYEDLCEQADETLEEYHQKMDETTFNKFNKFSKLTRLGEFNK